MGIRKLLTRDTNIIELSEKAKNNIILSNKLGYKTDLISVWPDWYKYNKELYFFKKMDDKPNRFVNELIGEKLSNILGIDTIHYEIAKQGFDYGLASKNFKKTGNRYYFMKDLYLPNQPTNFSNLDRLKEKCKTNEEYEILLNEILKALAIDLYMNQMDRYQSNIQFRKDKTGLHLAPLYDFEKSFLLNENYYQSNLLRVYLNSDEYIKTYPYLKEELEKLFELDIEDTLEEIEDERKIKIPNTMKYEYKGYVNNRKSLIKRTW